MTTLNLTDYDVNCVLPDVLTQNKIMRKITSRTQVTLDGIMQAPCADLVDEFCIWIFPWILGQGKRLFEKGVLPRRFNLVESRSGPEGILLNTYRPDGALCVGPLAPGNPAGAELARRKKLVAEEAEADAAVAKNSVHPCL